jgi:hypothetical protein
MHGVFLKQTSLFGLTLGYVKCTAYLINICLLLALAIEKHVSLLQAGGVNDVQPFLLGQFPGGRYEGPSGNSPLNLKALLL